MSDKKLARIELRSTSEFYETVKGAAKRAQISISDYTRLALFERMKVDAKADPRMES